MIFLLKYGIDKLSAANQQKRGKVKIQNNQVDVPSQVDVPNQKVHLKLLLYVLLRSKLSDAQKMWLGKDPEDLYNLVKIIWPESSKGIVWKRVAFLRLPHLKSVLQTQFPNLAQLDPPADTGEAEFQTWVGNQIASFGIWFTIEPEEKK